MLSAIQYDQFDTSGKSPALFHHHAICRPRGPGKKHEAWLATLRCPVLRLDGSRRLTELVAKVRSAIDGCAR